MINLHGISERAFLLIVAEEVASGAKDLEHARQVYERLYRRPEWPAFESGVTCGIGYDFGQNTREQIIADWTGKIPDAMVKALAKTAGISGEAAKPLAHQLRDVVDIPWEAALDVFSNTSLPRYLGLLTRACPGVDRLSPDCLGVLVSLTFNRGAGGFGNGTKPRFAEMREIRSCIKSGDIHRIPNLLRSMARLWPATSGVHKRRFREADLFELGLAEHHPEVKDLPPALAVPDPEVVAGVQRRLRELGYFDVGTADGTIPSKGRAEAAILAFRHEHDLPLTPTIDDELLKALATAAPRPVSETRAGATVDDLREQKTGTIDLTDWLKGWAGKLFGTGGSLGGAGLLAWLTDTFGGISLTKEQIMMLLGIVIVLLVVAAGGLLVWHFAHLIEQKRLADYRAGKNT